MKRLTFLCPSLLLMLGLSTFAFAACSPTKETAYDYLIYESTDGAQQPDFEKLRSKDVEQPTLHTVFYYIDKKTKQEVNVPLGSTLYAVWQKKDENGSVLIPLE